MDELLAHPKVRVRANGCIEWTGATVDGYGRMTVRGKKYVVHRFAWETVNGPIPPGMVICHTCDNRACFNPDHLKVGTQSDNIRDMVRKGRHGGQRKLNPEDYKEIRRMYATGWYTQMSLADAFGVSQTCISRIVRTG